MRVLYVQYTNPAGYPPLQHSSQILARNGWDVLFLGSGAKGADVLELPEHPRIRVKRMGFCPPGWRQKAHYAQFTLWVMLWTILWRPRWVYVSDPISCPIAALLSFVPGIRMLYHEHDSPNFRASASKFERFVLKMRSKVARRSSLCVIPNEERSKQFLRHTGTDRPVLKVWNCPALTDVMDRKDSQTDKFIIFFHGSIVPARVPMTILEALAKLPEDVVLHIAGYETVGHSGYVRLLEEFAKKLGLDSRFKFLGTVPSRHDLLEHCRQASVGLALMPSQSQDVNEQAMTGASNKPFDYLACGLALLVSDMPDWKKVFVDEGYALACDPNDSGSIARALRWFYEHASETRSMGLRGRDRIIAEWNYEHQFSPIVDRMEMAAQI